MIGKVLAQVKLLFSSDNGDGHESRESKASGTCRIDRSVGWAQKLASVSLVLGLRYSSALASCSQSPGDNMSHVACIKATRMLCLCVLLMPTILCSSPQGTFTGSACSPESNAVSCATSHKSPYFSVHLFSATQDKDHNSTFSIERGALKNLRPTHTRTFFRVLCSHMCHQVFMVELGPGALPVFHQLCSQ